MNEMEILANAGRHFADLNEEDFKLSFPYWQIKRYKKGEIYNNRGSICRYMGFITDGVFRSYIVDGKTADEKNAFIYSTYQFVVTFKSFINRVPCDYFTEALTDATVVCITRDDLLKLYKQSHKWETFGRLMAETAFNVAVDRAEGLLFKSPVERYLDFVKRYPDVFSKVPLYHVASYLGIQGPSLSRIRRKLSAPEK